MAPKKDITPSKKKDKYRTRNWKEYNWSLENRGSITFWFSEDAIAKWYSIERTGRPGRPDTYSDSAIRCGLMIKAVFRTALALYRDLLDHSLRAWDSILYALITQYSHVEQRIFISHWENCLNLAQDSRWDVRRLRANCSQRLKLKQH